MITTPEQSAARTKLDNIVTTVEATMRACQAMAEHLATYTEIAAMIDKRLKALEDAAREMREAWDAVMANIARYESADAPEAMAHAWANYWATRAAQPQPETEPMQITGDNKTAFAVPTSEPQGAVAAAETVRNLPNWQGGIENAPPHCKKCGVTLANLLRCHECGLELDDDDILRHTAPVFPDTDQPMIAESLHDVPGGAQPHISAAIAGTVRLGIDSAELTGILQLLGHCTYNAGVRDGDSAATAPDAKINAAFALGWRNAMAAVRQWGVQNMANVPEMPVDDVGEDE